MAESTLTVRTLALAMVALGLACVHAARGDGRASNISSFSGRAGSASSRVATFTASRSGGSGGSVNTIHGDAIPTGSSANKNKTAPDRSTVMAQRNAAGGISVPGGAVAGRPGRSGKPSALALSARSVPQLEVRKVSVMSDGSQVVQPTKMAMASPSAEVALDTELKKLTAPPRNAFALPGAGVSSGRSSMSSAR